MVAVTKLLLKGSLVRTKKIVKHIRSALLSILIIFLALFCELILAESLSEIFHKLDRVNTMVSFSLSAILPPVISATFILGILGGVLSEFLFGSRKNGYGLALVLGLIHFCSFVGLVGRGMNIIGLTALLISIFLAVIFAGLVYGMIYDLKNKR